MREMLEVDDGRLWLLVGLFVAMIFTIQAVEESVEGAWPHQRRPTRVAPRVRAAHTVWAYVALLVLPGLLLAILNVVVLLWRELPQTETQILGSLFVGLGWLIFVLVSVDRFRMRRYIVDLGMVGPLALIIVLLAGNALLLIALLDILPSIDTVREALPGLPWEAA